MQKVLIASPGGYDKLQLVTLPDPEPGAGEVLIDVRAAGVNFADCAVRMGLYRSASEFVGWPITPGFEAAGTVRRVGAGVTRCAAGDEVVALSRFGAYADTLVVPESQVFPKPQGLTWEQAGGYPVVFLTAYYALCELIRLRSGMKVLVHSAAGGVGSAAVQIAKLHGCEVAGVVGSARKVAAAEALGYDRVIDKSSRALWAEAERFAPKGYDVILDANGVETLKQGYKHLASGGRLVSFGAATMLDRGRGTPNWPKLAWRWLMAPRFDPLDMTNDNRSLLAFNRSYQFDKQQMLDEAMTALGGWIAEGKLRPPAVAAYPLRDVARAHRDIETGNTVGKLVLTSGS